MYGGAAVGTFAYGGTVFVPLDDVVVEPGLFPSDITTVLIGWMATNGISGDANTSLREALRTIEGYGEGMDLTTLMTQYDFNGAGTSGGLLREMPAGLRLVSSRPAAPTVRARVRHWWRRRKAA